jgi:uncharacterized protein (DUF58 family)
VEFAEHRQYNPGESVQHIDWKLYGRSDRLFVKRFEEETNLRCRIVIDASSSMQYSGGSKLSKLQYASWCAAVFVRLLKKQRDAVGIDVFDETLIDSSKMASSGKHYKEMWLELDRLLKYSSTQKGTNLPRIIHDLAGRMHRRSMILLFTDLLSGDFDEDELFNAIQHLKHQKQELILFHLLHSPTEREFEFGTKPVLFEDMETGEKLRIQAQEIKENYRTKIEDRLQALKLRCAQYKVDLVEVDTEAPVEKAVIPFLVKRNRMGR